ncbi:MAG: primosomal protein N' [Candidatus Polarisedimenticolaceae bacterium]|nr:primosomal protein N' [Candidatus Polarisedimenticolaceae bacterium]
MNMLSSDAASTIIRVVIAGPLRGFFDYIIPPELQPFEWQPGVRLRVPFGRSSRCAILLESDVTSPFDRQKLKPIEAVLDQVPLLSGGDIAFLRWAANYYQHPLGDVLFTALPARLRRGEAPLHLGRKGWQLTAVGAVVELDQLSRAPKQRALMALFQEAGEALDREAVMAGCGESQAIIRTMLKRGWLEQCELPPLPLLPRHSSNELAPTLNTAQQQAVTQASEALGQFSCFLLDGVTGSGKTEVYLALIEMALQRGEQVLMLAPEIGLTPQLVQRIELRFSTVSVLLHSGLSDHERERAWQQAASGLARIVIGTRSSIFTPLPELGLIIVDEEHDASFKQQEGFRYSARDLAVVRAQREGCLLLLGSATPSLESLYNVERKRYQRLVLPERAGLAKPPKLSLIDVSNIRLDGGLSPQLKSAIRDTLDRDEQVMLFLNRRGYAPVITCHGCGWLSSCQRCDAHMTLHFDDGLLWCHHCGQQHRKPHKCPACGHSELIPLGQGTERLEEVLKQRFPDSPLLRFDRDNMRRKGSLEKMLKVIEANECSLLIGTQMLAKGHHFPGVTLVGIIDMDQGLFSADYRAAERMAQMVMQVAGRAGRAEKLGRVLIQTRHPDHPLLQILIREGYASFAAEALRERRETELPPFSYQVLLRAESTDGLQAMSFLEQAAQQAHQLSSQVEVLGPIPAPMERRAGKRRAQLLLQANSRALLQGLLAPWVVQLDKLKLARRVRWSIDVDPQEMV